MCVYTFQLRFVSFLKKTIMLDKEILQYKAIFQNHLRLIRYVFRFNSKFQNLHYFFIRSSLNIRTKRFD
jgi:hypothetical protein